MPEPEQLFLGGMQPPAPPARSTAAASSLRALTLWQPWAHAVARLGKRIENRPWAPWPSVVGRIIAIHAAAKVDAAEEARAAAFIESRTDLRVPVATGLPRSAIVAVARVTGFVTSSADPWFVGPYGWQLADVIALPAPVPCRGMQGLWPVPGDVAERVLSQAEEVRRG